MARPSTARAPPGPATMTSTATWSRRSLDSACRGSRSWTWRSSTASTTANARCSRRSAASRSRGRGGGLRADQTPPLVPAEPVEGRVDHRRGEEREQLRDEQATHDGDTEGLPQLGAGAVPEGERNSTEERRQGGHHDGPEAQEARPVDRFFRRQALLALRLEREVDHHDGVLLHDADQEDDSNQCNDAELGLHQEKSEKRADARGRQRGEDRHRVHIALVEDPEHDVDGDERKGDQERLAGQGLLEGLRGSLEGSAHAGGQADVEPWPGASAPP